MIAAARQPLAPQFIHHHHHTRLPLSSLPFYLLVLSVIHSYFLYYYCSGKETWCYTVSILSWRYLWSHNSLFFLSLWCWLYPRSSLKTLFIWSLLIVCFNLYYHELTRVEETLEDEQRWNDMIRSVRSSPITRSWGAALKQSEQLILSRWSQMGWTKFSEVCQSLRSSWFNFIHSNSTLPPNQTDL